MNTTNLTDQLHLMVEMLLDAIAEIESEENEMGVKKRKCPYCPKKFDDEREFDNHLKYAEIPFR